MAVDCICWILKKIRFHISMPIKITQGPFITMTFYVFTRIIQVHFGLAPMGAVLVIMMNSWKSSTLLPTTRLLRESISMLYVRSLQTIKGLSGSGLQARVLHSMNLKTIVGKHLLPVQQVKMGSLQIE